MIIKNVRNALLQYGANNGYHFTLIDGYDKSIVGISGETVIYDKELMIREHMLDNKCSRVEAEEWIDYNVIRSLPYYKGVQIIETKIDELLDLYGYEVEKD